MNIKSVEMEREKENQLLNKMHFNIILIFKWFAKIKEQLYI